MKKSKIDFIIQLLTKSLLKRYHSQQTRSLLRLRPESRHRTVLFLLVSNRNSPSPDRYNISSDFEKSPKKGLTMGHSREECKSISIFNHSAYPGPGNYNVHKDEHKDVTMSSKLSFPNLWSSSIAPGPGKCMHLVIKTTLRRWI